jgi:hypothetical protein
MDGMVTMIPVAVAVPDKAGEFRIQIPDFALDPFVNHFPRHEWGTLTLLLREAKTWNHVCTLGVPGSKSPARGLEIQNSYPETIELACEKQMTRAH